MSSALQQTLDQAKHECAEAGIKLTPKRIKVLSVLLDSATAMSAYQLIEGYRTQNGETLKAMSVYRILNFLVDAGLVHRLETTNQYIACSHITCDHAHEVPQFLICSNCEKVAEVGLHRALVEELQASVAESGFQLSNQQLELHGLCKRCSKKK